MEPNVTGQGKREEPVPGGLNARTLSMAYLEFPN